MSTIVGQQPEAFLDRFGLTAFRPGQKDVIRAVLDGRDSLCIMPTGGGKSLCFQLPALMRTGVVLVISPLIALMKDQVDSLQRLGLRATFINSSLEPADQRQRIEGMAAGEFSLVYIAPERLRSARFLEAVRQVPVQLLAIDEAHCISEWGHDFRPDYARIGRFREKLEWPQTIALTATATADVRQDVIEQLKLRSPKVFITGFARPNLRFECIEPASGLDKNERLVQLIEETEGPVLVYASTRKRCEELVELLSEKLERAVGLYHAGLLPDDRRQVQDEFMNGQISVIVATNAFGMGIDKRNLRMVIHYNLTGTLEAYYQEAGRAGRDGLPARCMLLFSYSDRFVQEFFIENAYPDREIVRKVYDFLRHRTEDPIELTLQQIKDALDLSITNEGIGTCEQLLEKCGAIERLDSQQNQASVKIDSELPTLVDMLPKEAKTQRKVLRALEEVVGELRGEWIFFSLARLGAMVELDRDSLSRALRELTRLKNFQYVAPFRGRAVRLLMRDTPFDKLDIDFAEMARRKALDMEKLERVIRYAQTRRCRQLDILEYFGDPQRTRCETCDNCQPAMATPAVQAPSELASDEPIVQVVRMVLSGAARAKQSIGKELLAMMLAGSNSARISKLRLDKLSTYGLLSDLRQSDVSELIDAVIEAKLLAYEDLDRFRAVLTLTDLGTAVMRGTSPLPKRFVLGAALLTRLRSRRRGPKEVSKTGARPSPTTPASPATEQKLETTIRVDAPVRESEGEGKSIPKKSAGPTETTSLTESRPSHYWTWRLLSDGYPAAICRAIRTLDETTLLTHLLQAAQDGLAINPDWILTPGQQQNLVELLEKNALVNRTDSLPDGIIWEQVVLFREIRVTKGLMWMMD